MINEYNILSKKISVYHDDQLYHYYGGNKARKFLYILESIKKTGNDSIVTTGGVQSNHCRVSALASITNGLKCKIILHGDKKDFTRSSGNSTIMRLACADVTIVDDPNDISGAMDHAMEELKEAGYNPYYVYGGGHSIEGSMAYYDAVRELYTNSPDTFPDFIVLASGTGSTQAGIHVGIESLNLDTQIIGISVARRNPRGTKVVSEAVNMLRTHCNVKQRNKIQFMDDWVGEGYEMADAKIWETITCCGQNGLILDPTYTGKAFTGLLDLLKTGEIHSDANVLFWHTGGIFNLMASNF